MRTTRKVVRYQIRNVLRGKVLLVYGLFFLAATVGLIRMGGGAERSLPSLANIVLLVVPLASLLVTTSFLYDGRSFTQLLLSQPVARRRLYRCMYAGITLPMAGMFLLGAGVPLLVLRDPGGGIGPVVLVMGAGVLLTAVFTALGFVIAFHVTEAARGLLAALIVWLTAGLIYDGFVLLASHSFAAYPLERPMLVAMVLNPVDLARVVILMALDASALMGYTGAVFERFFGGPQGLVLSMASLVTWVAVPWALAGRRFRRMDL